MGIVSALLHQQQIQSFEDAFGVKDVTTQEMQQAIQTWFALYFDGDAPPEEDDCQRIPAIIVNKLYKTAFSEYSAGIVRDGAEWLSGELERLNRKAKTAVQYQLVGGECLIKPVLWGGALDFTLIRRDCFLPLARDADGKLLSVGTVENTTQGGWYYSLLERRTVEADGALTIESRLFRSRDGASLGAEVPLDALDKYAGLSPALRLPGIGGVGLVQLRTPLFNCVDGTADAVSVYAPAVGLIKNINRNERQLCQEFENGASRIIASGDLLKTDKYGNKRLSDGLFVGIDEDPEAVGITIFNPTLRESSYLARKQEYLRDCENLIGLKRGILSEVEAAERTATEITSSAGDYNLTIQDFQAAWEQALRDTLDLCARLGSLYAMTGETFDPQSDLSVDWGDGVLFDRQRVWSEYQSMVSSGLLKPELALAWYFDLPHDTPEDLARIREEYMPEMTETEE